MRRAHIVLFSVIALLALAIAAAANDKPTAQPQATQASAVGVTDVSATLQAKVVPEVAGTLPAFEYGTTTDYGRRVAASPAVLPLSGATATAPVAGLQPATTYHFRLDALLAILPELGEDAAAPPVMMAA